MVKKYIDQEKAEKIIAEVINRNGTEGEILTEIHYLPIADVTEVRHGRWIFQTYEYMPWCTKAICSSCKQTIANNVDLSQDWGKRLFLKDNLFCAKCGAKMDGDEE